jgi:predicted PurR-regulated permease PerM
VNPDTEDLTRSLSDAFTASLIRFALIAFVAFVCAWAFFPFLPIMLWSLVLAVALYPARQFLQRKLGWSSGKTATLIALAGIALIGVPTATIGYSFATNVLGTYQAYEAGTLVVPEPSAEVADWPIIGADLYEAWGAAAADLPTFLETRQPELKSLATWFIDKASGAAGSAFLLIGALIIAGIMLAMADQGSQSVRRIFTRVSDSTRGPELHDLATKTIRQVAVGIIGIAFVTAMALGIVMVLGGVPAAALLTVLALILAIMQVPVTLVAFLAAGLLWTGGETSVLHNTIFTILLIAASLTDNILKPLVLGRGLAVPMPVVLIGAIGGMMSGGMLGMFIGATFLAAGYQVFMKWVEIEHEKAEADGVTTE